MSPTYVLVIRMDVVNAARDLRKLTLTRWLRRRSSMRYSCIIWYENFKCGFLEFHSPGNKSCTIRHNNFIFVADVHYGNVQTLWQYSTPDTSHTLIERWILLCEKLSEVSGMETLCGFLNMPPPMSRTAYHDKRPAIHDAYIEVSNTSMLDASAEVRQHLQGDKFDDSNIIGIDAFIQYFLCYI